MSTGQIKMSLFEEETLRLTHGTFTEEPQKDQGEINAGSGNITGENPAVKKPRF